MLFARDRAAVVAGLRAPVEEGVSSRREGVRGKGVAMPWALGPGGPAGCAPARAALVGAQSGREAHRTCAAAPAGRSGEGGGTVGDDATARACGKSSRAANPRAREAPRKIDDANCGQLSQTVVG